MGTWVVEGVIGREQKGATSPYFLPIPGAGAALHATHDASCSGLTGK